jgi:hypothetical protein
MRQTQTNNNDSTHDLIQAQTYSIINENKTVGFTFLLENAKTPEFFTISTQYAGKGYGNYTSEDCRLIIDTQTGTKCIQSLWTSETNHSHQVQASRNVLDFYTRLGYHRVMDIPDSTDHVLVKHLTPQDKTNTDRVELKVVIGIPYNYPEPSTVMTRSVEFMNRLEWLRQNMNLS